jgi:hypothetical protein
MMLIPLTIIGALVQIGAGIKLWSVPAELPATVPATCKVVLVADIACGPQIIQPGHIVNDARIDDVFLGEYCNSTCSKSMETYINNVNTRCGATAYDWGDGDKRSAVSLVAPIKWARDTACLAGTSAKDFCYPKVVSHKLGFCDDCTLKYLASLLSSDQGAMKVDEDGFTSILSSCKVSPTKYPHSSVSMPGPAEPM